MKRQPYQILWRGLVATAPLLTFLLLAEGFLWRAGETVPVDQVAKQHGPHDPPAAYLPMLVGQQFNRFHYERVKMVRPDILVVGSSRVMRFRREMFQRDASFYNASRTIDNIGDLEDFVRLLPEDYAPKTLLLGVDFNWFNGALKSRAHFALDVPADDTKTVSAHCYAYRKLVLALFQGKIRLPLIKRILTQQDGGVERYGLGAWESAGFRNDGSVQAVDRITRQEYRDVSKPPTISQLKQGTLRFIPCPRADVERLDRLAAALKKLEKKGTFIIGFAPPLASDVHKAVLEIPIQAEFFTDATAKTAELFQKNGWPFYDGTDPGRFGLDDRCMWDGIHAMETYHVALLNVMANDPKVRRALHLSPEYLQALLSDPRTTPWYPVYPAQRTAMVQR